MAKKIAITNEKGGCGKTTTSVNLAAILAARGYKVLLIDADCQCYSTLYYGLYAPLNPSLFQVLTGSALATDAVESTAFGVDVLRSAPALKQIEDQLTEQKAAGQDYSRLMKDALAGLEKDYDVILIDCPPQSYKLMDAIHVYVDGLILPMIPDEFALHSLRLKAEDLIAVRRTLNPRLQILGGLLVMVESNATKAAYAEALQGQKILPIFDTVIRKNITLSRAINAHEPINVYAKSSNGNKDYQTFADELMGRIVK